MIKKNMIQFLQFRDEVIDIEDIEKKNNCKIPPIYRSFITVFEPFFKNIEYFDTDLRENRDFITDIYSSTKKDFYTIDDDELSLEGFMELSDSFKFEGFKHYLTEYEVIPISYHGHGGTLMLGVGMENKDKIYLSMDSTELKFMHNNIFELLQKIQTIVTNYDVPDFDENKLYKKWGEDFWRVND